MMSCTLESVPILCVMLPIVPPYYHFSTICLHSWDIQYIVSLCSYTVVWPLAVTEIPRNSDGLHEKSAHMQHDLKLQIFYLFGNGIVLYKLEPPSGSPSGYNTKDGEGSAFGHDGPISICNGLDH